MADGCGPTEQCEIIGRLPSIPPTPEPGEASLLIDSAEQTCYGSALAETPLMQPATNTTNVAPVGEGSRNISWRKFMRFDFQKI